MAKEMSDIEAQKLEKLKILQSTMEKIEKNYGKGALMKLGDRLTILPTIFRILIENPPFSA